MLFFMFISVLFVGFYSVSLRFFGVLFLLCVFDEKQKMIDEINLAFII